MAESAENWTEYDLQRIYSNLLLDKDVPRDVKQQAESAFMGFLFGGVFGAGRFGRQIVKEVKGSYGNVYGVDPSRASGRPLSAHVSLPSGMKPVPEYITKTKDPASTGKSARTAIPLTSETIEPESFVGPIIPESGPKSNTASVDPISIANGMKSGESKLVADTGLFSDDVLKDTTLARKNYIAYAQEHFPKSVWNADANIGIEISRRGLDKLMSGRLSKEKYASAFHVPELIERAAKVGEAENTKGKAGINRYLYFDSPISIDNTDYTAHIRVRDTAMGNKYYGHTLSQGVIEDIKIEPSQRSSAEAAVHLVSGDGSTGTSAHEYGSAYLESAPISGKSPSVSIIPGFPEKARGKRRKRMILFARR